MDRLINSKVDKHSIYEIYRACRLCGAGAGYKMPIVQNVIDIDGEEVDLKQKIRECVKIEVHQDDKMPPLICELCVDKVNDFYVFLEMCRQTNKRTRQRLGLPLQTTHRGSSDSGDCILGVTEPVYVNEDSDEPLSRSSTRNVKFKGSKVKSEIKAETSRDSRTSRNSKHVVSTKSDSLKRTQSMDIGSRSTRQRHNSNDDNLTLNNLRHGTKTKRSPTGLPPPPKSILKKESKVDDKLSLRSKRSQEPLKPAVPAKKVKLAVKVPPKPERRAPPPPPGIKCSICKYQSKTPQANASHMRSHTVTFTSNKLSCNSCREWFVDADAAADHHRRHKARSKPYICRACKRHYQTYHPYLTHTQSGDCVPWEEVPDVKCDECWKYFPTDNLRSQHKCPGVDGRPGGKCYKCSRTYALLKNLRKHESTCTARKRGEPHIDPDLLAKLKPVRILTARCDPLLDKQIDGHCDVADVPHTYGLDPASVYPYINSASLNFNRMVNIKTELDFYCEEDYVHWDSDVSSDDDVTEKDRKVYSLSVLALKTLFSQNCLGRVPRKKRKIKTEKSVFDSILGNDFDMSKDIDSIIDNLGDDLSKDGNANEDGNVQESVNDDESSINKANKVNTTEKSEDVSSDNAEDKSTENIDTNDDKNLNESQSQVDGDEIISNKTEEDNSTSDINKDMTTDSESILDNKNEEQEDIEKKETLVDKNEISSPDQEISQSESTINTEDKVDVERNEEIKDAGNVATESESLTNDMNIEQENVESIDKVVNDGKNINENEETKDIDGENLNKNITVNSESVDINDKNEDIIDDVTLSDDKEMLNEISNPKTADNETDNSNERLSNDIINTNTVINDMTPIKTVNKEDKEEYTNKTDILKTNSDINDTNDTEKYSDSGEEKSDKLNMEDFNEVCDSEIDDKKLMEDLDEHIGESNKNNDENGDNNDSTVDDTVEKSNDKTVIDDTESVKVDKDTEKEDLCENMNVIKKTNDSIANEQTKITLDDLLPKKVVNTPSMDLDNISDEEINFD